MENVETPPLHRTGYEPIMALDNSPTNSEILLDILEREYAATTEAEIEAIELEKKAFSERMEMALAGPCPRLPRPLKIEDLRKFMEILDRDKAAHLKIDGLLNRGAIGIKE